MEVDFLELKTLLWALGASVFAWFARGAFFASSRRGMGERIRELETMLDLAERDVTEKASDLEQTREELQLAREDGARLAERLAQQELRMREQLIVFQNAERHLSDAFKVMASDALRSNTEQFSQQFSETARALLEQLGGTSREQVASGHKLLETLGNSIKEKMIEVDRTVKEIEKTRIMTDAELKKQLEMIASQSERVGQEAAKLHSVLTNNKVQGEWGQIQLRNLVERAGMLEHCDFLEQWSEAGDRGRQRPDLIVRLPNNFNVIIDAKAPTKGFSEALREPDGKIQKAKLQEVANSLKGHVKDMSERDYPSQFGPALEYTLIFLPNESVFFGALSVDPELLSFAEQRKVIITTPLSLLAFLRAVACGWTQIRIQENAAQIQQLGKEMYKRMRRFMTSFAKVGKGLDTAVKGFNDAVGSSRNVEVSLRRFQELGAWDGNQPEEIEELSGATRVVEQESDEQEVARDL